MAPARPNIILIIAEQHRGDCLSIDGHPVLMTPNLDHIAGAGARFRRAYTSCPTCIAARRSILTGQYPGTHGMVGYRDHVDWDDPPVTLPAALSAAGYHTYHAGRDMHQTPRRRRLGFDHMVILEEYDRFLQDRAPDAGGRMGSGVMNNDYTAYPWPLADHLHHTNWTVDQGIQYLRQRDPSCPFFLNLSFLAAHPPLQPPSFYFDRYVRTGVPDPVIGDWASPPPGRGLGLDVGQQPVCLEGEKLLSARAGYYGLINHLDDQLRRLLNPYKGLVDPDNTIVVFVSDHGEMLGDHYRWHKIMPYEGAARIPFLIQAPSRLGISPGTVLDDVVSLEDLMPTLLDMAGVEIPDSVQGRSLWPVLRGEAGPERAPLHIEHAPAYHCLTDGHDKYVWFAADGREQLFDLGADPHELRDLSTVPACQERLAGWRARMVAELADRPEGFSNGQQLIPGRPYTPLLAKPVACGR